MRQSIQPYETLKFFERKKPGLKGARRSPQFSKR
ncbi:30S ribosomal protein S9 [Macrococcoides caseolyticum]